MRGGAYSGSLYLWWCLKDQRTSPPTDTVNYWDAGAYCIMKNGDKQCPNGKSSQNINMHVIWQCIITVYNTVGPRVNTEIMF